jgi:hypothetical protein
MPVSRPAPEGVLLILDERDDAEEIAAELRQRGQVVTVVDLKPLRPPG